MLNKNSRACRKLFRLHYALAIMKWRMLSMNIRDKEGDANMIRAECAGRLRLVRKFTACLFVALLSAAVGLAQTTASSRPEGKFVVPIAHVDRSYLRNEVTIQGTITSYKPSWRETAPHSFVLRDGTGNIRVAIWPNVWDKIPFKDQLREGQEVTARVTIAEFRGALEGHLDKPNQIWLGLAKPELASQSAAVMTTSSQAYVAVNAPPITWKTDIGEALAEAKKLKKNIIVLFANPDSDNGKFVEEKIFADPRIRQAIAEKFVAVRIDMRVAADLARQLQAFRAGTVGFYKSDGQPLRGHLVPRTVDELLAAMK
jgi:DNA/RNA endonuclease YhcR with UshA esterase domain